MDFYLSSDLESKIEKPAGVPFCGELKPEEYVLRI